MEEVLGVQLNDLCLLLSGLAILDRMRPQTGNAPAFRKWVESVSNDELGDFIRQIDQVCLNGKIVGRQTIPVVV